MPPDASCNLVLLNDNQHTFDYVIDMLVGQCSIAEEKAIEHAMEVHMNGRTIVMTCDQAEAELGRDRIHACGADPRVDYSKSSMHAVIEPLRPSSVSV
jgi:ATP-dependent Clp protease adaptor protein ClpS